MKRIIYLLSSLLLLLQMATPGIARAQLQLSEEYLQSYLVTLAASSCLGVYLPDNSAEFSYLRSYGWSITPYSERVKNVEAIFALAHNELADIDRDMYILTIRGSASKADWKVNMQTKRVNYGGSSLTEMQTIAAEPFEKENPGVHMGFNNYTNTMLEKAVLDANGNLRGVFKTIKEQPNAFLVLTGHSLGGAAATLLGERLVSLGIPKEKFVVITFGAPAVGNAPFADQYGDKIRLLRITNTADPIPGSLQTFFGGYKQFGTNYKYHPSVKVTNAQHDMAMYFDYSISEYYKAFDEAKKEGQVFELPDKRITPGVPAVALWIANRRGMQRHMYAKEIHRFLIDEYKRMFPSYIIMKRDPGKKDEIPTTQDMCKMAREAGAEYMLMVTADATRQNDATDWFMVLDQGLFDVDGHLLSVNSMARKVAPISGNIQAIGEAFISGRGDLKRNLPWLQTQHESILE